MAKLKRARGRRRQHEFEKNERAVPRTNFPKKRTVSLAPPYGHGQNSAHRQHEVTQLCTSQQNDFVPQPFTYLEQLPRHMATALTAQGFSKPTPVQSRCWPPCLTGRDLICVAPTGSGKTLGYALPLLELSSKWADTSNKIIALFLTPTRELAQQVAAELVSQPVRLCNS